MGEKMYGLDLGYLCSNKWCLWLCELSAISSINFLMHNEDFDYI
jgi:hypothetical protein